MENSGKTQSTRKTTQEKGVTGAYIAKVAMFSALATVLYLLRFPMPFAFASWLEIHFSDLPALIGGLALGPVAGGTVTLVRVLLKLLIQGTSSGYVGELADFLNGIAFVLPASFIYKYNRNKKFAFIGIAVGAVSSVVVALFANRFILIPFFAGVMGMDALIGNFSALFPSVDENSFYSLYLWASVLPFNTLRCGVVGEVTVLVYKRISKLLTKF